MNNFVRVEASTEGHPDGPVMLWVKNKSVVLSSEEAVEVANALMAFETPPPPEPAPEPPPPPVEEPSAPPS